MNYYDTISNSYESLHKEEQEKKLKIIKKLIKVKERDKLLDVGCGSGFSTKWKCKTYGIDPSIELLKKAKGNFIQAKAESLPFKDNSFNIVISVTAIQNFNNLEKGLKEIKRVGKDKFILTFLKKSKKKLKIISLIKKHFKTKLIEEEKDYIFVASS
jgi:ubiquinone/menaquinone biosynthesis C-methylase UbiE